MTKTKILATANPIGDKFRGTKIDYLKRHLPFDAALLSRFHLIFIIKKPSAKEFVEITKKIIAYEFLLKRVEELQKELNRNREEIDKWKDEKIKAQNVKERVDELTRKSRKFRWR